MTPDKLSQKLEEFILKYKSIRVIGGCCGTSPEHISELRKMIDNIKK
jgi:5-methyltetrahydrofolate--homocysteine methyltransferase